MRWGRSGGPAEMAGRDAAIWRLPFGRRGLGDEMDGVVKSAGGPLRGDLTCCLAYLMVLAVVGVVGAIVIVIRIWIVGR